MSNDYSSGWFFLTWLDMVLRPELAVNFDNNYSPSDVSEVLSAEYVEGQ